MDNDHARAKDAYDKIEIAAKVWVDALGVMAVPEEASTLLWLENGKLVCRRSVTKEEMKRLKSLAPEPWNAALDKVSEAYGKDHFTTLNTWALKVPSMLQSQGLLQTAAVLQDKFKNKSADEKNVYWLLSKWLLDFIPWPPGVRKNDLMDTLNALDDQEVFRFAHREAIAYMTWIKRAVSVNLAGVGQGG